MKKKRKKPNRAKAKAEERAADAIDKIVRGAKELAEAEQAYYGRKPKAPTKATIFKEKLK